MRHIFLKKLCCNQCKQITSKTSNYEKPSKKVISYLLIILNPEATILKVQFLSVDILSLVERVSERRLHIASRAGTGNQSLKD